MTQSAREGSRAFLFMCAYGIRAGGTQRSSYMQKSILIAIEGINNIGKSEQVERLVKRLRKIGRNAITIKFPYYDLPPVGEDLNAYLRKGNPDRFTPREFQILNMTNRENAQSIILSALASGKDVICEGYTGGGIAWGVADGVNKEFLVRINRCLTPPSVTVLLDGIRFHSGKETGHTHEENDLLTERARQAFLVLPKEYREWVLVNANQSREEVEYDVWIAVGRRLISSV